MKILPDYSTIFRKLDGFCSASWTVFVPQVGLHSLIVHFLQEQLFEIFFVFDI